MHVVRSTGVVRGSIAVLTGVTCGGMNRSELSMKRCMETRWWWSGLLSKAHLRSNVWESPGPSLIVQRVDRRIIEYLARVDVGGRRGKGLVNMNLRRHARLGAFLSSATICGLFGSRGRGHVVGSLHVGRTSSHTITRKIESSQMRHQQPQQVGARVCNIPVVF